MFVSLAADRTRLIRGRSRLKLRERFFLGASSLFISIGAASSAPMPELAGQSSVTEFRVLRQDKLCKAGPPRGRVVSFVCVALRSPHLPLILSIVPSVRNYGFRSRRVLFPRAALP